MIRYLFKFISLACLTNFIGSSAFGFIAAFPISGFIPETGEVISGQYILTDYTSNPEQFSLKIGEKTCKGLLYHHQMDLYSGQFTCQDGRKAAFEARADWFFVLEANPGGRLAAQYSIVGQGEIAGRSFTLQFNTAVPGPFLLP